MYKLFILHWQAFRALRPRPKVFAHMVLRLVTIIYIRPG
jgi:hypothetical protein